MRAHLEGLGEPGQGAIMTARTAASAALRLERLTPDADDRRFAALSSVIRQSLRALERLRERAKAELERQAPAVEASSPPGVSALQAHLAKLAAQE
jgi:hypothetical protein